MPADKPYVFLAQPSSGNSAHKAAVMSFAMASQGGCHVAFHPCQCSLLTTNFNQAWASCLNDRKKHGFTHFAMIHSDIVPLPFGEPWLDKMIAIADEVDADLLSAIVPIKNGRGLTSTALATENPWLVRRLTLTEIFRDRFETFSTPGLLVNTGLWVLRLGDWCEKLCFRQQDRLFKRPDGTFVVGTIPEDWDFSRQVHAQGKLIFATRAIPVMHDAEQFHTRHPWGEWERDEDYFRAEPPAPRDIADLRVPIAD